MPPALAKPLHARDDEPAGLAARLWDLPGWSQTGHRLLAEMAVTEVVDRKSVV